MCVHVCVCVCVCVCVHVCVEMSAEGAEFSIPELPADQTCPEDTQVPSPS